MGKLVANVDDDVKARAAELYESMGMSLSTAVNMFLRQSLAENGVPFKPRRYEGVHMAPIEATRRAMVEAEAKELGIIPDDATTCETEEEVRDHLRQLRGRVR
ncbi:type II toxin-antitoxin system RelB/DinJ family antitoxin [Bifidobacterium sp. 82T10]|uniref:Type II toxin-antitoxin system RelB/DinJ family antitoxin n=1 Tax=Bifidobacterium miconis TaxID=2834435 RepID=A0ABS6WI38_9BIFI|nr:type II toxin-antitoxin system RelB/DinJ family antitoxin [Bifidobacterium miconis]MBW3093716.1 type II toxin-antitoxin system RelB/DinJ family antitoxin [Bifidobacterium miconis]